MHTTQTTPEQRLARSFRRLRRLAALSFLLLAVAGLWEHREAKRYTATVSGTVIELTRSPSGGRGDRTPPRIEYTVAGRVYTLVHPRAVLDLFRFHQLGESVPLRYDPARPERAVIDLPWYRYPFTTTLALLSLLFLTALVYCETVARHRLLREVQRQERLFQRYRAPLPTRAHRRRILSALHRHMAALVLTTVPLIVFGTIERNPLPVLAALATAILLSLRTKRIARCPHCGASLYDAIAAWAPSRYTALWLRDLLAKGIPLECAACGRELDHPHSRAR